MHIKTRYSSISERLTLSRCGPFLNFPLVAKCIPLHCQNLIESELRFPVECFFIQADCPIDPCRLDDDVNSFDRLRKTAIASYLVSPVEPFKLDGLFKVIQPIKNDCEIFAVLLISLV